MARRCVPCACSTLSCACCWLCVGPQRDPAAPWRGCHAGHAGGSALAVFRMAASASAVTAATMAHRGGTHGVELQPPAATGPTRPIATDCCADGACSVRACSGQAALLTLPVLAVPMGQARMAAVPAGPCHAGPARPDPTSHRLSDRALRRHLPCMSHSRMPDCLYAGPSPSHVESHVIQISRRVAGHCHAVASGVSSRVWPQAALSPEGSVAAASWATIDTAPCRSCVAPSST